MDNNPSQVRDSSDLRLKGQGTSLLIAGGNASQGSNDKIIFAPTKSSRDMTERKDG